ncbi:ABC transporter substrate-binding protein [Kallotenue papyrolyticum]|uniref:ABC transporter substrate-binding protein n=1 Tax=Kallotenue papyrolyticum TaxID=1325125 RepID=UPI00049227F2|nr:ABC transporter substrate-binding protein [Kallotenue papyrolyticum]
MLRTPHWRFSTVALLVVALLLAACGAPAQTGTQGSPAAQASPAPESSPAATSTENKLEIFSWWTNPGEADGLAALFEIYKQRKPGVEIINATVAGGAGTNAKTVLVTRMQGGQPPDSFQVHAGQELIGTWVVADKMEPITQIFKNEGWDQVMPKTLLDQITYNGEIYSVPVNIHRSNVLWYNKKIFEEAGLQPPKTLDDFYSVAEALKAKGITPLAVGGKDKFEVPHLFESVLLASYGPDDYPKLFQAGNAALWADPRMTQAVETLNRMLSYANSDRSSLSWGDAAQLVLDGRAAMTIMGDWAHGYFLGKGAKPGQDYGWAPAPGTDGVFMWLSDSFGLPKGAPHRDNAIEWLKVVGSKEGQDAFNPKKGSIPARTDADRNLYDEYLQSSIDAFAQNRLAPSVVHGAAANEAFMTAYNNALNVFSADLDIQTLLQSLQDAVNELAQ